MIDERYDDDNNNILLLNSLFTNNLRTFVLQFRGIHEYRNRFFAYGLKIEIKTS